MKLKSEPVAWVNVIGQDEATGDLASAYEAVRGAEGRVENLYLAMSQTPQAIKPANDHYLALLHNPDNPLEPWLAEYIATYVAVLCGCDYAIANHGENFSFHFGDRTEADRMLSALYGERWPTMISDPAVLAAIRYARKLSVAPMDAGAADIELLRAAGFCDKSISYIIQIVASFAYWARMINGLGTQLSDTVGFQKTLKSRNAVD